MEPAGVELHQADVILQVHLQHHVAALAGKRHDLGERARVGAHGNGRRIVVGDDVAERRLVLGVEDRILIVAELLRLARRCCGRHGLGGAVERRGARAAVVARRRLGAGERQRLGAAERRMISSGAGRSAV